MFAHRLAAEWEHRGSISLMISGVKKIERERESAVKEWLSSFSLYHSISINLSCYDDTQQLATPNTLNHRGERRTQLHATQKRFCIHWVWARYTSIVLIQIIHSHNLPSGHASLYVFMHYLCAVLSATEYLCMCVMLYLSCNITKTNDDKNWRPTKNYPCASNMGAGQVTPRENLRQLRPWKMAFLSHPPTLPQSRFSPVIT